MIGGDLIGMWILYIVLAIFPTIFVAMRGRDGK